MRRMEDKFYGRKKQMSAELNDTPEVTDSTGNVFADLGLPASEEDMLKVHIAYAITVTLRKRGLTQKEAAEIIGTDQAKISALLKGRLKGFGVERLIHYLVRLGRDVDVKISKSHGDRIGKIRVHA
jgi:predicted XRE-type DNA-binding protein